MVTDHTLYCKAIPLAIWHICPNLAASPDHCSFPSKSIREILLQKKLKLKIFWMGAFYLFIYFSRVYWRVWNHKLTKKGCCFVKKNRKAGFERSRLLYPDIMCRWKLVIHCCHWRVLLCDSPLCLLLACLFLATEFLREEVVVLLTAQFITLFNQTALEVRAATVESHQRGSPCIPQTTFFHFLGGSDCISQRPSPLEIGESIITRGHHGFSLGVGGCEKRGGGSSVLSFTCRGPPGK